MKKLVYLVALLGVAAGSFAFLPKEEEPTGYMMVIGTSTFAGFTSKATVSCVTPDGKRTDQDVPVRNPNAKQITEGIVQLHLTELAKLNELRQAGWHVISTNTNSVAGLSQTCYLLEKH